MYRVALLADIKKGFFHDLHGQGRLQLRFLWIDDVSKENPEVVSFRFARVVLWVSFSLVLLNATI